MIERREVVRPAEKAAICNAILRALPAWFGIESSIVSYVEAVGAMPFYAAYDGDRPVGFAALKRHSPFAAEIYVMGLLEAYHRRGIGRLLIAHCEAYCRANHVEFLTVKTLDGARANESYQKTRLFYLALGFRPLEVFPLLWDEANPCLFLAKAIK